VTLILHNFSPKAFGFQVFTTDKKTDPHLRNVGFKIVKFLFEFFTKEQKFDFPKIHQYTYT
ncbi:hypothetical protein, partial [Microcoleus sp. PH2017_21_RUC_O_A]|uniref:hypothetical protein n=1 Tax=Microcoleus sp. PH2017_21_RUC_O_A TaxID=2798832 RepID=UPI0025F829EC